MAHPLPVLGIIGKKRSGKDTLARYLGYDVARVAFADPLKRAALDLDPLVGPASIVTLGLVPKYHPLSDVVRALGWEAAKDNVPGVRQTLQNLGVAIRAIDEDFWVNAGLAEVAKIEAAAEFRAVAITDVRFPNEADRIRSLPGGRLIRIVRPGTETADAHISETALDDYGEDALIVNDGSLETLADQAAILRAELIDGIGL